MDMLPADPRARRTALIVFAIAAVAGSIAVWWLSTYIETLTTLARTDREASLKLFRTQVMPALVVVVLVAVVGGAVLLRQGLQILQSGQFPPEGARLVRETRRQTGAPARAIGVLMATAGFLMAAVPLVMLSIVLWMLRRA